MAIFRANITALPESIQYYKLEIAEKVLYINP
jgi:hypothetical protein